jgi:7 transmembrane sweet-taste receptor of 3 GCPR
LVTIQGLMSIVSCFWTYWYQHKPIVKASQPVFLYLISFGCFILASSIIPTMMQGEYRYVQDRMNGVLTDIPNPNIRQLDAACMAFPWLAGLGFSIVFSALFAKIWRVKKLIRHAERFSRKKVEVKDVIIIMVAMITFEFSVLLAWQLIDPLRWEREVIRVDDEGFPLVSVGECTSDQSIAFIVPLCVFNCGSLIYALYLCWITRNVPSDFSEGVWITLSVAFIFQVLLLAVPVLLIASENTEASFFVRGGMIFLCNSTVSVLIFGPKMWRNRQPDANNPRLEVRKSNFSSANQNNNNFSSSHRNRVSLVSGLSEEGRLSTMETCSIERIELHNNQDPPSPVVTETAGSIVPDKSITLQDNYKGMEQHPEQAMERVRTSHGELSTNCLTKTLDSNDNILINNRNCQEGDNNISLPDNFPFEKLPCQTPPQRNILETSKFSLSESQGEEEDIESSTLSRVEGEEISIHSSFESSSQLLDGNAHTIAVTSFLDSVKNSANDSNYSENEKGDNNDDNL